MNPNYVHTITLFQNQNGAWLKTVLHHCFWKSGIAVSQTGTEATQANSYTVRIPLEEAGPGFLVRTGDIVVLGECSDTVTGKSPDTAVQVLLRNKPNAFKVTAYSDNTSFMADRHYRIGG